MAMEKMEADLSKWQSGIHNLTLISLAKLQVASEETVVVVH